MNWYEIYLKEIEKNVTISNYIKNKIKQKKELLNLIKNILQERE